MEQEVDFDPERVKMEEEHNKESEEEDYMTVKGTEKNEDLVEVRGIEKYQDWVGMKGTEMTGEETKEGIHDSTMSTIQKLKVCCNTIFVFHKAGKGIKDIAIRARGYIKELIEDQESTEKNKSSATIVKDIAIRARGYIKELIEDQESTEKNKSSATIDLISDVEDGTEIVDPQLC